MMSINIDFKLYRETCMKKKPKIAFHLVNACYEEVGVGT